MLPNFSAASRCYRILRHPQDVTEFLGNLEMLQQHQDVTAFCGQSSIN
jgi:hypothetical protein